MKLPAIATPAEFNYHFASDLWRQAAAAICQRHKLPYHELRRSAQGENIIFFVDDAFVIKIYGPFRAGFEHERAVLDFVQGKLSIETPTIVQSGELEGLPYLVMTRLAGVSMREVWANRNRLAPWRCATRIALAFCRGQFFLRSPVIWCI
jgi:aminoglycoside phosphotransferase